MDVVVKRFEELSAEEIYEILKVRVAVFVVEQNCA
ncbi:MAG TPA: GNAT family N-acetyltransferase, partial [Clostridiales bacterium]|nr:GNAT family N-acetyltransferase [Clostridiales bacterium]